MQIKSVSREKKSSLTNTLAYFRLASDGVEKFYKCETWLAVWISVESKIRIEVKRFQPFQKRTKPGGRRDGERGVPSRSRNRLASAFFDAFSTAFLRIFSCVFD